LIDLEDLLQVARRSTPMARMLRDAGKMLEYTEWASRRLSNDPQICSTKVVAASAVVAKRHGLPESMHIGAAASTGHRWAFDEGWISEYVRGTSSQLPPPRNRSESLEAPAKEKERKDPRKRASLPSAVRMAVWNAYFGREAGVGECYCCGEKIFQQAFECGHVVAAAKGGSDAVDNLRPLCSICNRSQGDDHMDDFIAVYFPTSGSHGARGSNDGANGEKEKEKDRARMRVKRSRPLIKSVDGSAEGGGLAPMVIE